MRNGEKLLIGITSVLAIGLTIYLIGKTRKDRMWERLDKIAEEGYETAADILYPLKNTWTRRYKSSQDYNSGGRI
jgi:hypothetical protein